MQDTIIVTGGAGFIGSNFVRRWMEKESSRVVVLDALTYAGMIENLVDLEADPRFRFVHGDINDETLVTQLFIEERPRAIVHFAAESHVDRSVVSPGEFIRTNVNGTFNLLQCARVHAETAGSDFRFLHVSTDEVYGSLGTADPAFHETTAYAPNSPYSASKAASDHLVRAYHHTYGLSTLVTNCSNNYGPYQFPEKLIPLMILNARNGEPLPVYGDGLNIRDWLYVTDHCDAIHDVLAKGTPGETYNVGGNTEKSNIEVVKTLCSIMDELAPLSDGCAHESLITYVKDRPGHDRRYAIDTRKIQREIGWEPRETFSSGLRKTVEWYLKNPKWIELVRSGEYNQWVANHYGKTQRP